MTYDEAIAEIESAAHNAVAEGGPDGPNFDDAAHDIAISYFGWVPPKVAREIARCYLGWDPVEDYDLFERHGITREQVGG